MLRIWRKLALALAMAFAGTAITAAPAQATETVYTFSGTCIDCGFTPATGALTLSNYAPGSAVTLANLVKFTYSSSLVSSFVSTSFSEASGVLGTSGPSFLTFVADGSRFFSSVSPPFDFWCFGPNCSSDFGVLGSWTLSSASAVPEPGVWLLMLGGLGAAGLMLRMRRRKPLMA